MLMPIEPQPFCDNPILNRAMVITLTGFRRLERRYDLAVARHRAEDGWTPETDAAVKKSWRRMSAAFDQYMFRVGMVQMRIYRSSGDQS